MGSSDFAASNAADLSSEAKAEQQEAVRERTAAEEGLSPRKWRSPPERKTSRAMLSPTRGSQVHRSQDEGLPRECRRSPSRPQRGEAPLQGGVRDRARKSEEARGSGPFFYFGGGNGAAIVTSYCESRGWRRIHDNTRDDYKLKWCEVKSKVAYYNFREGEQLLFQIPSNKVLTTKIGLLCSLREYERVSSKVNHGRGLRRLKMEDFFPDTFRMDVRDEKEAFFAQHNAPGGGGVGGSQAWICKPTGLNQGRGIFLLRTEEELRAFQAQLQSTEENQNRRRRPPLRPPQARIVQRYIQNPLLLKGRKFDVRSYFLIACTAPYMVFFRHGYVRLTCDLYDPNSNNLSAHLTNQYMQKKNPRYSELKEETVWSMERFNAYVNEQFREAKALPQDWVLCAFAKRMQVVMTQCFLAVRAKLERKLGLFDLIGCDFMIDEDFKVWLLEMNCNPALTTNCQVLKEVVPSTVDETLDLTLEIFSKCQSGARLLPLASQRNFVLLFGGDHVPEHQGWNAVRHRVPPQKSTATPRTQKAANEAADGGRSLPAPSAQAPPPNPRRGAENRRPLVVKVHKPRGTWLPVPKSVHLDTGPWEYPSEAPWLHRPNVQNRGGRGNVALLSAPGPGGESQAERSTSPLRDQQHISACLQSTQLHAHQGQLTQPCEEEQHGDRQ
ncbi:protein polyglycylase TTLL10 isoform X1 [Anguilla rostrata]|uniref:protein polyglycylase TTLL10 isoform X1 n=1 Tax=Anguilla rostrata TaxID=7938 RepID=UPI0030D3A194